MIHKYFCREHYTDVGISKRKQQGFFSVRFRQTRSSNPTQSETLHMLQLWKEPTSQRLKMIE